MIAPDMATMLSFVVTDMPIAAPVLQALLARHVQTSFNAITVDSDTSTSDTLLAFATGKAARRADREPRRSARRDLRRGAQGRAVRPRHPDRARWRRRHQAGLDPCRGRHLRRLGLPHRQVDRRLAAGQDRHCRRGRQLGPRGHGRGQGRRTGRSRQARHPLRRPAGRQGWRARRRLRRGRHLAPI